MEERQQKVFGARVFCFGWYDHGRCGSDPATNGDKRSGDKGAADGGGDVSADSPSKRTIALRSKSSKKKAAVKLPTYTTAPMPVNSLTSAQTNGTVDMVATGERHSLVITTRGQVLAFGDNTKYQLGSKQRFSGRLSSPSRSSTRPNTASATAGGGAAGGGGGSGSVQLPSLLLNEAVGKIIPGAATNSSSSSSTTTTSTISFQKKPDTLASDKRRWKIQDQAPRIFNTDTPVEVDLHRAGCIVPVSVHAGACTSYVLDGNGKLYSWGENHHGQCGLGEQDLIGMDDDEINTYLDTMRKGPVITKAKRWKAPGAAASAEEEKKDEFDEFLAVADQAAADVNASSKETTKKSNTVVSTTNGSVSGLRRGGGYNAKQGDRKNRDHAMTATMEKEEEEDQKKQLEQQKHAEVEEMPYGVTVTNKLVYQAAGRPMTRRAYVERPFMITALSHKRVKMISCGHRHVIALMLGGGLLYGWGYNRYGQLGLGGKDLIDVDYKDRNVPVVLPTMRKVRCSHVSCGRNFTVALGETDDGRFLGVKIAGQLRRSKQKKKCMFVWGQNDSGQFGCTKSKDPNQPHCHPSACKAEPIWSPKTPDKEIVEVYAGGNHVILKCLGEVLSAVGNNRYGQLGLGDLYDRDYPMYIDTIGGVKLVSAGARHTMATTANNVLYVWGFNCVGEMGTGDRSLYLLPEQCRSMRELRPTYLCAGDWHSAVIATDMPDETVPMWREPNCHPDMHVSNDEEGHDSLTITHVLSADQLDDPMYAPEFVYVGLANPPVGHPKVSQISDFRWDIKVEHLASGGDIPAGIGVAIQDIELCMDPEQQVGAFVYLATGEKYDGDMDEGPEEYGEEWWWDDVIGVEINRQVGYVRFYKNGIDQGIAFYKDWDETVKMHLYTALAGEGDRLSIVYDSNAGGAKDKDALFEGKLLCDNITIAEQGAAPIDVFFECMSCQVTICRACAYQCHNGHSVNLQISFGNMRCVCVRSKCDDHECLSLPVIGDEDAVSNNVIFYFFFFEILKLF